MPVWPPDVKVQLLAAAGTGVVDFAVERERGRVTKLLMPDLYPGSLLLFPAEYFHAVNPYGGERPRITPWNINYTKLSGDRADGWKN